MRKWYEADVARAGRGRARGVVVEAAEQVVRARLQLADALVPAGIDFSVLQEEGDAGIGEFAVRERRSEVADAAIALADEGLQPALRGEGIAGHRSGVVPLQRVAELVEGRARADQRLLVGAERLADVDQQRFVVGGRLAAKGFLIILHRL